jgi:hypothetical protein
MNNYKEIITELERMASTHGIRVNRAYDIFVDFVSKSIFHNRVEMKYKEFEPSVERFLNAITPHLVEKPFYDHFGRVMEHLSLTNFDKGQFYTPPDLAETLVMLNKPQDNKKAINISELCVGTGSIILPFMRERDNPDDYFFLIDCDLTALKALIIQMYFSYIVSQKAVPKVEVVCGDALFIDKDHKIIYTNTHRELYDIDIVRKYQLYKDEINRHDKLKDMLAA